MAIVINGQTGIDAGHLPISNAGNTEVKGTLTGVYATVSWTMPSIRDYQ